MSNAGDKNPQKIKQQLRYIYLNYCINCSTQSTNVPPRPSLPVLPAMTHHRVPLFGAIFHRLLITIYNPSLDKKGEAEFKRISQAHSKRYEFLLTLCKPTSDINVIGRCKKPLAAGGPVVTEKTVRRSTQITFSRSEESEIP